ncbi:hypothetical protein BpHYR1_044396 [Brachionus plicatilis]|uniref:Uncharacterized protein n=1 Tax=Brachionus plicatilis TaxID=10195 RepID=A0A3M7SW27_BRAPC|nr:hypothetical protein BpHYR1_044396 [Brachionus plicatilis]
MTKKLVINFYDQSGHQTVNFLRLDYMYGFLQKNRRNKFKHPKILHLSEACIFLNFLPPLDPYFLKN